MEDNKIDQALLEIDAMWANLRSRESAVEHEIRRMLDDRGVDPVAFARFLGGMPGEQLGALVRRKLRAANGVMATFSRDTALQDRAMIRAVRPAATAKRMEPSVDADVFTAARGDDLEVYSKAGSHHPTDSSSTLPATAQADLCALDENLRRVDRDAPGLSTSPRTKAMFSMVDLADMYRVSEGALDKILMRWRPSHRNGEWLRVRNRKVRSPKYLYRETAVQHLIIALQRRQMCRFTKKDRQRDAGASDRRWVTRRLTVD